MFTVTGFKTQSCCISRSSLGSFVYFESLLPGALFLWTSPLLQGFFYVLSCGRLASFIHTLCFIFFTCCSRGRGPLFVGQVYIMFPACAGTLACSWRKSDTSVRFRTKHAMVLIQIQHMKGYQVKWKVERGPTHATWGYSKFHQTVSGKQNQSDWRVASFE